MPIFSFSSKLDIEKPLFSINPDNGTRGYTAVVRGMINNAGINISVIFDFPQAVLGTIVKDRRFLQAYPDLKWKAEEPESVINELNERGLLKNVFESFQEAVLFIVRKCKAPAFGEAIRTAQIQYMDHEGSAACIYTDTEGRRCIKIGLNFALVLKGKHYLSRIFRHELYHLLATVHHDEDKMSNYIVYKTQAIIPRIMQMEKDMDAMVASALSKVPSEISGEPAINFKALGVDTGLFFRKMAIHYWNIVADMGLNFVAMQLRDIKYARHFSDTDGWKHARHIYLARWEKIKAVEGNLKDSKFEGAKQLLYSYLSMLEFIEAYLTMPFHHIPYAFYADEYFPKGFNPFRASVRDESSEIIVFFDSHLLNHMSDEAKHAFFPFWENMKTIAKDMKSAPAPSGAESIGTVLKLYNSASLLSTKKGLELLHSGLDSLHRRMQEEHEKIT